MQHTVIFAAEWPGEPADVGHCWVAIEYPKHRWTVRGFYPQSRDLGPRLATGVAGVIRDDHDSFAQCRAYLRTQTWRSVTALDAQRGLAKIAEYGGGRIAAPPPPPRRRQPPNAAAAAAQARPPARPAHAPSYLPAPDLPSRYDWGLVTNQCAVFALEVLKAAGLALVLAVPRGWVPQAPVALWAALGEAGMEDAKRLPRPFGTMPA